MRSPAGERIDMGHVACALDWQVNPSPTHDLLVDLEEVTLTGDLAAAVPRWSPTVASRRRRRSRSRRARRICSATWTG